LTQQLLWEEYRRIKPDSDFGTLRVAAKERYLTPFLRLQFVDFFTWTTSSSGVV
jgi:hypothetical protein